MNEDTEVWISFKELYGNFHIYHKYLEILVSSLHEHMENSSGEIEVDKVIIWSYKK